MASKNALAVPRRLYADFCNKIGTKRTSDDVRFLVANGVKRTFQGKVILVAIGASNSIKYRACVHGVVP